MGAAFKWARRFLFATLVLLGIAWIAEEGAQWLLRWRAEQIFAEINSLELNRSTWSDTQQIRNKWGRWSFNSAVCTADDCRYSITVSHLLPPALVGSSDDKAINWLPRLMDHIGLRSAATGAVFTVEHGVVTQKSFGEEIGLPVRDWYLREGAYVPDLTVSSGEVDEFRNDLGHYPHPYRRARTQHGAWGIVIDYTPDEDAAEQSRLMNFRFACFTQFRPCESESDILPEGLRMLQEQQLFLSSR